MPGKDTRLSRDAQSPPLAPAFLKATGKGLRPTTETGTVCARTRVCMCTHMRVHLCAMHLGGVCMFACACACMFMCAYVRMHVHMCAHKRVYVFVCARTRVHAHVCVCARARVCPPVCNAPCACVCSCVHTRVHACSYVCLCACMCIHVHTRPCVFACARVPVGSLVWGSGSRLMLTEGPKAEEAAIPAGIQLVPMATGPLACSSFTRWPWAGSPGHRGQVRRAHTSRTRAGCPAVWPAGRC